MNEILDKVQKMNFEDVFFSWGEKIGAVSQDEIIALSIAAVIGILLCILGLKIIRVWSVLLGFAAGLICGCAGALFAGLDSTAVWIVGGVAGAVLAFLGGFFYRFGIFLLAFIFTNAIFVQIVQPRTIIPAIIGLALALAAAVLAVVFVEVLTILLTSVWGGILAGTSVYQLLPLEGKVFSIIFCVIFTALGIVVQLLLESGKRKRKNLEKAAEIRQTHSTENEIERARAMMDDLDGTSENDEDDEEYEESEI